VRAGLDPEALERAARDEADRLDAAAAVDLAAPGTDMAPGPSSADGPARPASPSSSFYAMSDDEEGGYNTITHTETGRGVKLLFSKSKVA